MPFGVSSVKSWSCWSARRLLFLGLLAALVLVTAGCFGGQSSQAVNQLEGTVESFVGDRAGESAHPIAGVTVTVGSKSATADAKGRFKLTGLAQGEGTLVVSGGKKFPAQEFPVTIQKGTTNNIKVSLKNLHQVYINRTETSNSGAMRRTLAHLKGSTSNVSGCNSCHSRENPQGPLMFSDATNALCTSCHTGPDFQHPAIHLTLKPSDYPGLDPQGKYVSYTQLSCLTCHRPHKDSATWEANGLLAKADLGLTNECSACHSALPSTHPTVGTSACSSCHDQDGIPHGHATCSGYTGKYGTPCHQTSSTIAMGKHADRSYPSLANGCQSCHNTGGTSNAKLLRWPNTPELCYQCHKTGFTMTKTATTGHGKCTMCHDPHRVEVGKVNNPANPAGALLTAPKETYRSAYGLTNAYCQTCHKVGPPAGFTTAKDPYTQTSFTNLVAKPDTSLHRVHVLKPRPHINGGSYYGHGIPDQGDVNDVRCIGCHSVHPTAVDFDLRNTVITSRTKTGSAYNGKSCGVGSNCHTCNWCHAAPGGPGSDCQCSGYHYYDGHSIVY